jgi:hypothetical protein
MILPSCPEHVAQDIVSRTKVFCGMLDGLAFLPVCDVTAGLAELKEDIPEGFDPLVEPPTSWVLIARSNAQQVQVA